MTRLVRLFQRSGRHILASALSLAGLFLIGWSAVVDRMYPCRTGASAALFGPGCQPLGEFLVFLVIALGFWVTGVVTWLARQKVRTLGFFIVVADVLATGMLAGTGADVDAPTRIFYVLLAWAIPLTFHFHHSLLERPAGRTGRIVLGLLYLSAIALSLPFLFWTINALQERNEFAMLRTGLRLGVVAAWALGWALLFRNYRRSSLSVRRRIRLITFGTLLAFAPLVFLSFLPDTLGVPRYFPFEVTVPWLLLSPLAYGYALFRRQLVGSDVALNRAGVYYLLTVLFLSIYLIVETLASRFAVSSPSGWPLLSALLSVLLLLLFAPIKRAFETLMSWILYGGEVSYVSVIGRLADSLSVTLDRETLRHLLVDELTSIMRLDKVALFLNLDSHRLSLIASSGFDAGVPVEGVPGDGDLGAFLKGTGAAVGDTRLRREAAAFALDAEEQALLSIGGLAYWVPLVSGDGLQGLLLIGPRREDAPFTAEDERILATVSRQAGIAAHNVRLMEQVRVGRQEVALAHQQSLAGYERERRQLALELHDGAVQQLLGISYQVLQQEDETGSTIVPEGAPGTDKRRAALEEIRCGIVGVVTQLRGLIGELRPPGLEDLGLAAAIEEYVTQLEREAGPAVPEIELDTGEVGFSLPNQVSLCLFRAAQEALRNALKHAGAQHIRVRVQVRDGTVELAVEDDGRGFRVPHRLSELASHNHFGLMGIAERAAWVGGQLDIQSKVGSGTTVCVRVPQKQKETDYGAADTRASRG